MDLSSSAVRVLALGEVSSGFQVEACMEGLLPQGAALDSAANSAELVIQAIADVVRRSGSKRNQVAIAVPGSLVISRQISMPVEFTDADIEQQINLESDQFIPYPLDDVYFDFVVLGPNARNPQTADVLLIVARNDVIDRRVEALASAGLSAAVVDVEAYALESAFPLIASSLPRAARDGITAMVDVGGTSTTLNVLQKGATVFTREQSFGGEQLLLQLQERHEMNAAEARAAIDSNNLPGDSEAMVLAPFMDSLASQVGRLLQVFFSATGETTLDQVVLSGGCAGLPGVADVVGQYLGIDTRIGNPFSSVQFASGLDAARLRATGHAWMIAAGLAMRSMSDVSR
ncbi:MAG: type IV pilus assembly protein PilM [Immundisolibacter sp.]|uniref:type IV pilus assembly protein PilM n=1 Tax=Immundisolibacter sp. TaxID=1934948 RepID=UPI003D0B4722